MKDFPSSFWALMLAGMGAVLAVVFYVIPGDVTSRQAAFQIASALVTGALGAFAGHAAAMGNMTATGPNATINPPQPAEPAQPLQK